MVLASVTSVSALSGSFVSQGNGNGLANAKNDIGLFTDSAIMSYNSLIINTSECSFNGISNCIDIGFKSTYGDIVAAFNSIESDPDALVFIARNLSLNSNISNCPANSAFSSGGFHPTALVYFDYRNSNKNCFLYSFSNGEELGKYDYGIYDYSAEVKRGNDTYNFGFSYWTSMQGATVSPLWLDLSSSPFKDYYVVQYDSIIYSPFEYGSGVKVDIRAPSGYSPRDFWYGSCGKYKDSSELNTVYYSCQKKFTDIFCKFQAGPKDFQNILIFNIEKTFVFFQDLMGIAYIKWAIGLMVSVSIISVCIYGLKRFSQSKGGGGGID